MNWSVIFHPAFEPEFDDFPLAVRREINANIEALETMGPQLGRKRVDTLEGSRHSNMRNCALMPPMAFGELLSLSILRNAPSFWSLRINPAPVQDAFTAN